MMGCGEPSRRSGEPRADERGGAAGGDRRAGQSDRRQSRSRPDERSSATSASTRQASNAINTTSASCRCSNTRSSRPGRSGPVGDRPWPIWRARAGPRAAGERALREALSAEQAAAKRLFVSLVTPGEGREDTRARRSFSNDPATLAVVDFRRARSPSHRHRRCRGTRSAEVSHEALIRHWDKLRAWVDENRENLRIRGCTSRRPEGVV